MVKLLDDVHHGGPYRRLISEKGGKRGRSIVDGAVTTVAIKHAIERGITAVVLPDDHRILYCLTEADHFRVANRGAGIEVEQPRVTRFITAEGADELLYRSPERRDPDISSDNVDLFDRSELR
jgi:hypothetical protein